MSYEQEIDEIAGLDKTPKQQAKAVQTILSRIAEEGKFGNIVSKPNLNETLALALHEELDDTKPNHLATKKAIQEYISTGDGSKSTATYVKEKLENKGDSALYHEMQDLLNQGAAGSGISASGIDPETLQKMMERFTPDTTEIDRELARLKAEESVVGQQASMMTEEIMDRMEDPFEPLRDAKGRANIFFSQPGGGSSRASSFAQKFASIKPKAPPEMKKPKPTKEKAAEANMSKKFPALQKGVGVSRKNQKGQIFGIDNDDNPYVEHNGIKYSEAYKGKKGTKQMLDKKDAVAVRQVLQNENDKVLEKLKKQQGK